MLFNVTVLSLNKIYDIPGSWIDRDYISLMQQLEVEDVEEYSGSELFDILLMALQDLGPEAAADAVLTYKLAQVISSGSRQNIVQDLVENQHPWEEASDIRLHARIFMAAVLLNKVFPKSFDRPDMMQLVLHLQCLKPEAEKIFNQPPEAAFVTRMLADGMNENSILERLFDEQLRARSFPEADGIIWQSGFSDKTQDVLPSAVLTVYSSFHWLHAMAEVSEFRSQAYNDRPQTPLKDQEK